jgi:hypothetical protein
VSIARRPDICLAHTGGIEQPIGKHKDGLQHLLEVSR